MKKFLPASLMITFFVFFPVLAASAAIVPCATTENSAACTLCHLIVGFWNLIDYGFKILVFVALTGLVIAGIMYILSAGSEQMITTAKSFIKSILYGFGFVLAAWLLIFIVMNYFGVKSDLGISKGDGWTKFECETSSTASATSTTATSDGQVASPSGSSTTTDTSGDLTVSYGSSSLPDALTSSSYNQSIPISASGGTSPYTYSCSGSGVAGLTAGVSGSSCVISGTPTEEGTYSVTVTAQDSSDPANQTQRTFTFQTAETSPILSLSRSSYDFGDVTAGENETTAITISNTGNANLTLNSISVSGNSFSQSGGTCNNNQTLAPNSNCAVTIQFAPGGEGSYSGTLTVESSDTSRTVSLSGEGEAGGGGGGGGNGTADLGFTMDDSRTVITGISGASGALNAHEVSETVTIVNTGNASAGSFTVKMWMSGESYVVNDYSDLLYTWNVSGLAAGQSLTQTLTSPPLSNKAVHSYYYLVTKIDADDQITESNEATCAYPPGATVGCNTHSYPVFIYR